MGDVRTKILKYKDLSVSVNADAQVYCLFVQLKQLFILFSRGRVSCFADTAIFRLLYSGA